MSDKEKNKIPVEDPQETETAAVEQQTEVAAGEEETNMENTQNQEETIEQLKAENERLKQEVAELKDKYLRLMAEFDNYRKRTLKERTEIIDQAARDTMAAILPVLDDFDRAKASAEAPGSKEQFSEGVNLVYQKLYKTLESRGLEPMESTGKEFNPDEHEAISEVPAPSEDMKGKVVDTVEKGYKLKGKIIRHAKVVVGK
ncbi:MAG: nucleotide exchange factor GrpE [Bacteroidetes bacterium]|nr:MAG: nucleotide exchange factor GrpE [Bacteroidota bacterium]